MSIKTTSDLPLYKKILIYYLDKNSYNIFGQRILIAGALTYLLYVGSFLSKSNDFTIAAGAILGIGAGFLWTAQAGIMMSYPAEKDKCKAFSLFWMVFNL